MEECNRSHVDNFSKIVSQIRIKLEEAPEMYAKEQSRDTPSVPLSSGEGYGVLMSDQESSSLKKEKKMMTTTTRILMLMTSLLNRK